MNTVTKKKPAIRSILLAILIPAAAASFFMFSGIFDAEIHGNIAIINGPAGDFTIDPGKCFSGQRRSFYGVMLYPKLDNQGAIFLIEDAVKGKVGRLQLAGSCQNKICKEIVFNATECKVFDLVIEETSTQVNRIRSIDGHAKLDCQVNITPENKSSAVSIMQIKGEIHFEGCH